MTKARIFVTYSPAAAAPASAAPRSQRSARPPVAAMVATALLTGGGMHSLAPGEHARSVAAARVATARPHAGVQPVQKTTLAYLAVAPHVPPQPQEPAKVEVPARASRASIVRPKAAPQPAPRRRDLAGFFEERGYTLALPEQGSPGDEGLRNVDQPEPVEASFAAAAPLPVTPVGATTPAAGAVSELEQTYPMVEIAGRELGALTMRGDRIHLASLVGLLALKLPGADLEALKAAPAADSFVSLETLRASGIEVSFDPSSERISLSVA